MSFFWLGMLAVLAGTIHNRIRMAKRKSEAEQEELRQKALRESPQRNR